jgi:hypothetical protein
MTNQLFDAGREGFLDGSFRWTTGTIKAALVRGYAFNAAHKFVSDTIAAGAVLHQTSDALAGKTATAGVASTDKPTLAEVSANGTGHVVLIFQSSAPAGGADLAQNAQRMIALIDTGANIPVMPNGGDVTLAWDTGPNKIFKL